MHESLKAQYTYVVVSLKEFASRPMYLIFSVVLALIVLCVLILLPNYALLKATFSSDFFSSSEKLRILLTSFGAFDSNFTVFSRITTVLAAMLIGLQSSLLVLYMRKRIQMQKSMGVSVVGMVVSLLGVGCTACGSVILSSIFGISAVTAMLGWLPLKGKEIAIVGLSILVWSVWFTAYKSTAPTVCSVKKTIN